MAKFEGYERREAKILGVLKEYGISSIDECKEICDAKGIDPYTIVQETQPICFENAKWAYTVGAAIAIKKGCVKALTLLLRSVSVCRRSAFPAPLLRTARLAWVTETLARCCSPRRPTASASWQVTSPLLLQRVQSRSRSTQTRFA